MKSFNNVFKFYSLSLIFLVVIISFSCSKKEKDFLHNTYNDKFTERSFSEWKTNDPDNWEIINENGTGVLHLKEPGVFGKVRKPSSYAILNSIDVSDFELTVEAKCLSDTSIIGRDMVVIFGYQDSVHFYYAHISNDNHRLHNIIGLVNGQDRQPISEILQDKSKIKLIDYNWHQIKVIRNSKLGTIKVFVDDMTNPIHSISDKTLKHGKIGLGSFDDFGKFKNFKLQYN